MKFFDKLFKSDKSKIQQPEDLYNITITEDMVMVETPSGEIEQMRWGDIDEIWFYNTDKGPFEPDIWLVLIGRSNQCTMPHGNKEVDRVYDIVSKYPNFNYGNVIASMGGTTDNRKFLLWKKVD